MLVCIAALAACTEAPPSPSASPSIRRPEPTPTRSERASFPTVELRAVARADQPVAMAARAGDGGLYIAEKTGAVRAIVNGSLRGSPVLDLRGQVSGGNEQGLLGIAFSLDGSRLYVNYTDLSGDTRVVEYRMEGRTADPGTRRELLSIDQPYANHNGGMLAFGPDGFLYISTGDGGSGGDAQGNAQSLDTLLGKILRIDPDGDPYTVSGSNPFVGGSGRDEIWAYGLRNPWRFSFDRETGDMWIGDVGQGAWEEIDVQPAASEGGENYGWDRLEGRHGFEGSPPDGHVLPVHEYRRDDGNCAVTGGYVYRGEAMPGLRGWYLFGDYCRGEVLAFHRQRDTIRRLEVRVDALTSFGEDASGELYVLSQQGPIARIVER